MATKAIVMTTLQKTIVTMTITAAVSTVIYEAHQASTLQSKVRTLQQQQVPMANATSQLAALLAENQQLKSDRNMTELLTLRGEVTQIEADTQRLSHSNEVQSASNERMSNLLAILSPLASQAETSRLHRTNVFDPKALRDLGAQTLDDAAQTILYALFSHDVEVFKRIVITNNTSAWTSTWFDRFAPDLQGVSKINFEYQYDYLDGSVKLQCRLKYAEGDNTNYLSYLYMRLQPVDQRWGVDSDNLMMGKMGIPRRPTGRTSTSEREGEPLP